MDDYGISLPGGVKPEPNVNAALRVLTIHHDLIDTVKVIILHTFCDKTYKKLLCYAIFGVLKILPSKVTSKWFSIPIG